MPGGIWNLSEHRSQPDRMVDPGDPMLMTRCRDQPAERASIPLSSVLEEDSPTAGGVPQGISHLDPPSALDGTKPLFDKAIELRIAASETLRFAEFAGEVVEGSRRWFWHPGNHTPWSSVGGEL